MAERYGVCRTTTLQERMEERAHKILTMVAGSALAVSLPVLIYALAAGIFPV